MGLFDSIPVRENGQDIEAGWFNIIRSTLNSVFDLFALNDLTDVDITAPSNGEVLIYNSISGNWENGPQSGGGGGGQLEDIAFIGKGTAAWTFEPPTGIVNVGQNTDDSTEIVLATNVSRGFTFVPTKTGDIRIIQIALVNRGAGNQDGIYTSKIYATSGGIAVGAPLATSNSASSTASLGINNVVFVNTNYNLGTQLQAGVKYAAMIISTDTGTINMRIGATNQTFTENLLETGPSSGSFALDAEQRSIRYAVQFDNLAAGGELVLDSDCFISVPNLLSNRHKIAAQTISMEDDQAAWVTVNRAQAGPTTLTVTVDNIINIVPDGNKLIFAQSVLGECHLGMVDPQRISNGEIINVQKGTGLMRMVATIGAPKIVDETVGILIGPENRQAIFTKSIGGAKTVTANPQVSVGTVIGQELVLIGTSDADYLELNDGTGLKLNGPLNLKNNQSANFLWDGNGWQEISRR